jgi:hypothetical protein
MHATPELLGDGLAVVGSVLGDGLVLVGGGDCGLGDPELGESELGASELGALELGAPELGALELGGSELGDCELGDGLGKIEVTVGPVVLDVCDAALGTSGPQPASMTAVADTASAGHIGFSFTSMLLYLLEQQPRAPTRLVWVKSRNVLPGSTVGGPPSTGFRQLCA